MHKKIFVALIMTCTAHTFISATQPGVLDTTFNSAGIQPGTVSTTIDGVAIQTDGKIIAAGYTTPNNSIYNLAVARFNTNGTLDTTFNPAGVQPGTVSTTIDNNMTNEANGVAIQTNGKIIAAGYTFGGGTILFAIARFEGDPTTTPTVASNACALRFIEKYGARLNS